MSDSTVLTTARFIGEDGSCGFKKGRKYAIDMQTQGDKIVVKNHYGDEFCPYDTMALLKENWEIIGPDEAPDAPDDDTAAKAEVPAEPPKRSMTIMDTEATGILDPNLWLQMKSIAKDFFESGVAPKAFTNPLQILMALQIGKEMGMQPGESLQSLTVINGHFGVWGKAVPRRLREHGWGLQYDEGGEGDAQYCTATITKDGESFSDTVKYKEAIDSGYTTDSAGRIKPGWKPGLNRRLKLRYDALDVLIKTYVPEVYGAAAGVAEVLLDIPAEDAKDPADERRDRMKAADDKRKELTSGNHTPKAVEGEAENAAA